MSLPGTNTARTDLCEWLCVQLAKELRLPPATIDPDEPMVTYGLDSLTAAAILAVVEQHVGFKVDPNALWDHPTAAAFAGFLAAGPAAD
ncbi:acyl carrier protein [Actinoplanes sp. NPDC049548]|uniref:acyl carrier protein n=1 Tax=Actinoplanes sp. NPDC049548 TaxID=3155152 RepID=UPI00343FDC49